MRGVVVLLLISLFDVAFAKTSIDFSNWLRVYPFLQIDSTVSSNVSIPNQIPMQPAFFINKTVSSSILSALVSQVHENEKF